MVKESKLDSADRPAVAVLLATYNGAAYCEDQILSLLWQRGVDVHIHVRDDGSRDDTNAIVARIAARHPGRITIIPNGGMSTGSATGSFLALLGTVDLTPYSHVALADQDDIWLPDKLIRAVRLMQDQGAAGYSSDLIAYHEGRNAAWMLRKAGDDAELDYLFQGGSAGCTYVLSAQAAQLVASVVAGIPDLCPDASHDWIIYAICRSRQMPWVRDRAGTLVYRQHAANLYGSRQGFGDVLVKLRLTRSRWYRDHILWLQHVVPNGDAERQVFNAISRRRLRDRWYLLRNARRFRRDPRAVWQLRAAILLGMI